MAVGIDNNSVLAPDGSAASPSISFLSSGGQGNGFFLKSPNVIGLAIKGVEIQSFGAAGVLGQSLVADGSTGAPAYSFASHPNTGVSLDGSAFDVDIIHGGTIVMELGATRIISFSNHKFPDGTVANPGFGIQNDNLGFYRPATNTLGCTTNGVQAFNVDANQVVNFQKALSILPANVASAATIIAMASTSSSVILTGSTATALQGITAGVDGQVLKLINKTGQNLNVQHQNVGASAANRITTMTGADIATTGNGAAEFVYSLADTTWYAMYVSV